mmetsp:Transcript_27821/g.55722  ORF Transcript_27821/g.55722 Transcript_27821/m.55722 type:complete len:252 (-) Transcript_27821:69-824(-)
MPMHGDDRTGDGDVRGEIDRPSLPVAGRVRLHLLHLLLLLLQQGVVPTVHLGPGEDGERQGQMDDATAPIERQLVFQLPEGGQLGVQPVRFHADGLGETVQKPRTSPLLLRHARSLRVLRVPLPLRTRAVVVVVAVPALLPAAAVRTPRVPQTPVHVRHALFQRRYPPGVVRAERLLAAPPVREEGGGDRTQEVVGVGRCVGVVVAGEPLRVDGGGRRWHGRGVSNFQRWMGRSEPSRESGGGHPLGAIAR